MRTVLLSLALLAATPMVASTSSYLGALPTGRIKVDVVKSVSAPRSKEWTAKLQTLITTEPARMQVSADGVAEPREPWEQRLAMSDPRNFTREEQAEAQRASDVVLEKTGEAVIEIVRTADGRMMLQSDGSMPELSGIILDVANDRVETPFGRTNETAEVSTNEDRFAPGAWSGTQWQLDAPGELPSSGTNIQFAIGRLSDDRVVLKYQAKHIEEGKAPYLASYTLVFSN